LFFIVFLFCMQVARSQNSNDLVANDTVHCTSHDTTVVVMAEENAKFQGNDMKMFYKFIGANIRCPMDAMVRKLQGKVFVSFVVNWDGTLKDIKLLKSSGHKVLDVEALRVVMLSPKWIPARNNGVCVSQSITVPVVFKNLDARNRNDIF